MTDAEIKQAIEGHDARNEALRQKLDKDAVDLNIPREIDCHFWLDSKENADRLASILSKQGFRVKTSGPAIVGSKEVPWNLEMVVRQSIDLTLTHEFADELVRRAADCGGRYDGWGTAV
jgi:regulator of RNase E activity RraB